MKKENIPVLIDEETLKNRVRALADEIREWNGEEPLHMVCILKGAVIFFCDLARELSDLDVTLDFMSVSSYQNGTESNGIVRIVKDLDESLEGRNVLLVEDIVDSGYTLHYVVDLFRRRLPKKLAVCTLLDKPSRRKVDVDVRFKGFEIDDLFIVGYGLDYAQHYRCLPFVGYLEQETEE